ncbi:MAG: ribonuclease HI [Christensenellales bacterium]
MKKVDIYTDGACSGNPGIGGWCAILIYNGIEKTISGFNKQTTNNRMEVFAIIQGLAALKERCEVTIYSDSAYAVNVIENGWLESWKRNGWRTGDNKEVKNIDLWNDLSLRMSEHNVRFVKVKGHADNEYNNLCDKTARAEIDKCRTASGI